MVPAMPAPPASVKTVAAWLSRSSGTTGSGTNTSAHAWSRSTTTKAGARGAITSPTSTSFSVTRPPTGETRVVSPRCFCSVVICAVTTLIRARAASTSSRRAPARTRARVSSAVRTRLCAALTRSRAMSRLVAASSRCLREPEFDWSRLSKRSRSCSAAASSDPAADWSARAVAIWASACRTSSGRAAACTSFSCESAAACSAFARSMASSTSRVSSVITVCPGCTRSPSLTLSVSTRPPASGAIRTSVASTWPETRMRSVGASSAQPMASTRSASISGTVI